MLIGKMLGFAASDAEKKNFYPAYGQKCERHGKLYSYYSDEEIALQCAIILPLL
jgi:hypothetical protein